MAVLVGILLTLLPLIGLFGLYVAVLTVVPANAGCRRDTALLVLFAGVLLHGLMFPFELFPGVRLDASGAVLVAAVLFAGPWVGVVTAVTACLAQWYLGDAAVGAGVLGLVLNLFGVLWLLRGEFAKYGAPIPYVPSWRQCLLAGFWAGISDTIALLLVMPSSYGWLVVVESGLWLAAFQWLAFLVMGGLLYAYQRQQVLARALQASRQALDFSRQEQDERFEAVFEHAAVGIALVSPDGRLLKVNGKLCETLGRPREALLEVLFQALTHQDDLDTDLARMGALLRGEVDTYQLEKRYLRADGSALWANLTVSLVRHTDGAPAYFISFIEDISERREFQQQISTMAFQDALTGLPNRRLFMDRLGVALRHARRSARFGAVLLLDLDHFKTLNDTRGHDVGDRFLQAIASRLQVCVRAEDTVARLGGDEFVVILESLGENEPQAAAVADRLGQLICLEVTKPFYFTQSEAGGQFQTTASIGICLFGEEEVSLEDVLKYADLALYDAKAAGRNGVCFFNAEMQYTLEMRAMIQSALSHALAQDELIVFAQPQVDENGDLLGAELLLRWQHPKVGWISPSQFIPLAEEIGAIMPIGRWVMRVACETLVRWSVQPLCAHLSLSVNVSVRQFRQSGFVDEIKAMLAETGAPAQRLKLEFTESIAIDNVADTIEKMAQLSVLGIRFSMDDFGTGYSSLSYLKRLPLDQLKIDQSFVRDINTDPDDAAIVAAILSISHSLGLEVVAEGVETEEQQYYLMRHGCRIFQGYLFGRPCPLPELEKTYLQVGQNGI